jgi:hypothetical protein
MPATLRRPSKKLQSSRRFRNFQQGQGLMKSEPLSKEFNHKNGGIAFAHIDPSHR